MIKIKLPKGEWEYDPNSPLGDAGGFGEVFAGKGKNGDQVAIKQFHSHVIGDAHRELRIADELIQQTLEYVVPIIDAGKDAVSDSHFVVMLRAERSLQQEIDGGKRFTDKETAIILRDIVKGLLEVQNIVHRDLKPGNVLYHDGQWKVADFGIARFVEESTSLRTLRDCLSPPYAAPEQWRLERATPATDIYGLGCIAYALLTGNPPFPGPTGVDYQHQHLHETPPSLSNTNPRLKSLVALLLRKPQEARPNAERVMSLLDDIIEQTNENSGKGFEALAQAGAKAAEAAVRADALRMERETRQTKREEIARSSLLILRDVIKTLGEGVLKAAPAASLVNKGGGDFPLIQLGSATLEVKLLRVNAIPEDAFKESGWDVVAGAAIRVTQCEPEEYQWSANLWYTDLGRSGDYRWWEVPYFKSAFSRPSPKYQPFALYEFHDADLAASTVMTMFVHAAEPCPVDDEDTSDFCNRWAELLSRAYQGNLKCPSHLPYTHI